MLASAAADSWLLIPINKNKWVKPHGAEFVISETRRRRLVRLISFGRMFRQWGAEKSRAHGIHTCSPFYLAAAQFILRKISSMLVKW
jgi:hypothetical protein